MKRFSKRIVRRRRRNGAVTAEMAIVLPILFLFFFAQFELVRLNNIRNSIYLAAYEGARTGIVPGATADEVETRAGNILASVSTINPTITVTPEVITDGTEDVTVTISVPLNDNAWITPRFAGDKTLVTSVTLVRERDDTVFSAN